MHTFGGLFSNSSRIPLIITSLLRLYELTYYTAVWKNEYFHQRSWQHNPFQAFLTLQDNEFVDCWQEVQNIALQPAIILPSTDSYNARAGISATFPQLRSISIVVNPFVDLERSICGEAAVCAPTHRCRLVEADGDTTWPERQPPLHWLDNVRQQIELLQAPDRSISLSVQNFEVYVGRQGRKQWKKYPVSNTLGDEVDICREMNE